MQTEGYMKIADMHCDTIWWLDKKRLAGEQESLRTNTGHIDSGKLKKSSYAIQNFALFVKLGAQEDSWLKVQELMELYRKEIGENADLIAPVLTYGDIERNEKAGKLSAMVTVEEGGVCGGRIDRLNRLYEQGVRMMTLIWNYPNELGYPNLNADRGKVFREEAAERPREEQDRILRGFLNTPDTLHGLTEKGREFVARMEALGMIVDVSHMSDAGFYDVLQITKKPFVASHSNARKVCPCARNMSDDMIRSLAERGGVMGLNFCADFLTQLPAGMPNPGTIDAVVRHARHIAEIGGMECIGIGSDFDGIDTHAELPGAEAMGKLYDALYKGGFTESQIDRIFYGNVMRVYREVL